MNRKVIRPIESPKAPETLHSLDEVAARLGLSHWTLRSWVRDGKINSNKQGRRRLVSSYEIERLLEEGRRPMVAA